MDRPYIPLTLLPDTRPRCRANGRGASAINHILVQATAEAQRSRMQMCTCLSVLAVKQDST